MSGISTISNAPVGAAAGCDLLICASPEDTKNARID
jgi:hypothetical protein